MSLLAGVQRKNDHTFHYHTEYDRFRMYINFYNTKTTGYKDFCPNQRRRGKTPSCPPEGTREPRREVPRLVIVSCGYESPVT